MASLTLFANCKGSQMHTGTHVEEWLINMWKQKMFRRRTRRRTHTTFGLMCDGSHLRILHRVFQGPHSNGKCCLSDRENKTEQHGSMQSQGCRRAPLWAEPNSVV
eukprot:254546-Pelagomonas_calceolata.AAC.1